MTHSHCSTLQVSEQVNSDRAQLTDSMRQNLLPNITAHEYLFTFLLQ